MTTSYVYYCLFFHVSEEDVTGGDTIRLYCKKIKADANDIYVDCILIFFLGDGESGPQVQAHNVLRPVTLVKRVMDR